MPIIINSYNIQIFFQKEQTNTKSTIKKTENETDKQDIVKEKDEKDIEEEIEHDKEKEKEENTELVKPKKIVMNSMGIKLGELKTVSLKKTKAVENKSADNNEEEKLTHEFNKRDSEKTFGIKLKSIDKPSSIDIEEQIENGTNKEAKEEIDDEKQSLLIDSNRSSTISVIQHAESIEIVFNEPPVEFGKDDPCNKVIDESNEPNENEHSDTTSIDSANDFPHVSIQLKNTRSDNEESYDELSDIYENKDTIPICTSNTNNSTPTVTPVNLSIGTPTDQLTPQPSPDKDIEVFTFSNDDKTNSKTEIEKLDTEISSPPLSPTTTSQSSTKRRLSSSGSSDGADKKSGNKLKSMFRKMKSEVNIIEKSKLKRRSFRKSMDCTNKEHMNSNETGSGLKFWQNKKMKEPRLSNSGLENDPIIDTTTSTGEVEMNSKNDEVDSELKKTDEETISYGDSEEKFEPIMSKSLFDSKDDLDFQNIAKQHCTNSTLARSSYCSTYSYCSDSEPPPSIPQKNGTREDSPGHDIPISNQPVNEFQSCDKETADKVQISVDGLLSPDQIDSILATKQRRMSLGSTGVANPLETSYFKTNENGNSNKNNLQRPTYLSSVSCESDEPLPRTNFSGERLSNCSINSKEERKLESLNTELKPNSESWNLAGRDIDIQYRNVDRLSHYSASNRGSLILPEFTVQEEDEPQESNEKENYLNEISKINENFLQNEDEQDDYFPSFGGINQNDKLEPLPANSVRTSGIVGLKEYLENESLLDDSDEVKTTINRLGHSVAVEKLKTEIK